MHKKYPTNDFENFKPFVVGHKKVNLIQSLKDHVIRIKKAGSVPVLIGDVWRKFSNLHVIHWEIKRIKEEIERLETEGNLQPI